MSCAASSQQEQPESRSTSHPIYRPDAGKVEADRDACPLDWPSNYSLLRLWHVPKDLHQFVDQLRKQMNHRHMFSHWEISYDKFMSRVLHQLPTHYAPEATLHQHVQNRDFPSRRVRKKPPQGDIDEFKAKCSELRRLATTQEAANPVSFTLENSWTVTLKSDKHHYWTHYTSHDIDFSPPFVVFVSWSTHFDSCLIRFCFTLMQKVFIFGMCLSADWTGALPLLPPSFVSTFAVLRSWSTAHLHVYSCACP